MNAKTPFLIFLLSLLTACGDDDISPIKSDPLIITTQLFSNTDSERSIASVIRFRTKDDSPIANVSCTSLTLILVNDSAEYSLPILQSSFYTNTQQSESVCPLGILGNELPSNAIMKLNYAIDGIEQAPFLITDLDNTVSAHEPNTTWLYENGELQKLHISDDDSIHFKQASFDTSGAALAVSQVLEMKFGTSFTEKEVMEGFLVHGDPEAIIQRKGFSLLDMKSYIESLGHTANGYSQYNSGESTGNEVVIDLEQEVPFIMPLLFNGLGAYAVVEQYNSEYISLIHPHLGYITIQSNGFNTLQSTTDTNNLVVFLISN